MKAEARRELEAGGDPPTATRDLIVPETDPLWQAIQRLPVATESVAPEELEAAELALEDLLTGRVQPVGHEEVTAHLERMRAEQAG
ncbi:MAG: hypothetical protein R3B70_37330 [Polyangiaceae bacterium]